MDAFAPASLGPLRLRNRVLKAATFEGMSKSGDASRNLVAFHERLARGGVGMTTVAYCAVSDDGRTFSGQLRLSAESRAVLRELTAAVHDAGAKVSLQLSHAGMFTKLRTARGPRTASFTFNAYGVSAGIPFARAMTPADIAGVVDSFGHAAETAVAVGFDAIEVHLGHGYLLSQFLSPLFNHRKDEWGGSLENRLRLPIAVLERVRRSVGPSTAVIAKTNLADGVEGGLGIDEAVAIARAIEASGLVDLLVPSGGLTSKTPFYLLRGGLPLKRMAAAQPELLGRVGMRVLGRLIIDRYDFEESFFLPLARRLRAAVRMPVALLGGVVSAAGIARARQEGFDFVVLGRALIADPDLVSRMERGEADRSRCVHCNECIAEMDIDGVRCVLDAPPGST